MEEIVVNTLKKTGKIKTKNNKVWGKNLLFIA